ncbi:MAG: ABC transporter ATP-binding protein, partial [Cyanobacteria bacterium P01_H01_bin.15]
MASWRDLLGYFRDYRRLAILSITATCVFELLDLVFPYVIGQILNVLSNQPVDSFLLAIASIIHRQTGIPNGPGLMLGLLVGIVFVTGIGRA